MKCVLNISMAVINQWAKSFNCADAQDIIQELNLLDLLFKAGKFVPSYDWNKTEENLGAIYLTLKYRLGENTISIGSDTASDWDNLSGSLDSDESFDMYEQHNIAMDVKSHHSRVSSRLNDADYVYEMKEELMYDKDVSMMFDRYMLELNTINHADVSTMSELFGGLLKRRSNETKVVMRNNLLKNAAIARGLTEAQFNELKERYMPSNKAVEVDAEEAVEA